MIEERRNWILGCLLACFIACIFDFSPKTCEGRCGFRRDASKQCQCNQPCVRHGDCCHDYQDLCQDWSPQAKQQKQGLAGGSNGCGALADVSEYFWRHDVNRLMPSQLTVNWQSSVADGNIVDRSPDKFFTSVDETAVGSKPTFTAFLQLLDNYDHLIGSSEFLSGQQWEEIQEFYNLIRATPIFKKLYDFLLCTGRVTSESDFRSQFYDLWFDLYPRSSAALAPLDSSGFEHTMVGEVRASSGHSHTYSVVGLHNWLQFYREEKAGRLNYFGYVRRVEQNVVGSNFAWRPSQSDADAIKTLGSFFVGTSPEFELALYTLCAVQFTNKICHVRLGGTSYRIQTWDLRHKPGLQIGSAYPVY